MFLWTVVLTDGKDEEDDPDRIHLFYQNQSL